MAETDEASVETKGSKKKLFIILGLAVLLLGGGAGAGAYFFLSGSGSDDAAAEAAPAGKPDAIYTKLRTLEGKPMFVVTLQSEDGKRHYMQTYVEALSRDQAVADALTLHMPVVVARLNSLFSTLQFETLMTAEGKQSMRLQAKETVQAIMQEKIGRPGIESVLFTNFVMQ